MHLVHLDATGFRNLEPVALEVPPGGVALLGPNGHGKTNLLEAAYYPVLFRSFRGGTDGELTGFDGPGFRLQCRWVAGGAEHEVAVRFGRSPREKSITVDGAPVERVADAVGRWLAVAFIPADTVLSSGPASGRRQYLNRLLALSDPEYLSALTRYRAALAQRNAALRQHSAAAVAAFEPALARAGSLLIRRRIQWIAEVGRSFAEEFAALGEDQPVSLGYSGREELAAEEAWPDLLAAARSRDESRGVTTVGPQRHDLVLEIGGRPLRVYGSTGQQRGAAVALKLLEWSTLERETGEVPALLLDDVFAELDGRRQSRLAERLRRGPIGQVLISAPRQSELPERLELPIWEVERGTIRC